MGNAQAFETLVLPHLDAAYNLARWLMRNDQAAQDVVQEAVIRALRHFASLRGDDARPWLLGIVRNTCFTALERLRNTPETVDFDEAAFEAVAAAADGDPAAQLAQRHTRTLVDAAIAALSPPLREVLVLREFEDLDYASIAAIVGTPVGTVMSRLSRAREKLRAALSPSLLGD